MKTRFSLIAIEPSHIPYLSSHQLSAHHPNLQRRNACTWGLSKDPKAYLDAHTAGQIEHQPCPQDPQTND